MILLGWAVSNDRLFSVMGGICEMKRSKCCHRAFVRCLVYSNMTGVCAFAMEEIGQGIFLSAGLFGWEPEIANYEELVIEIER